MNLLFALLIVGADFDTATVECLRVEVRHELTTEIREVKSRAHWPTPGGYWVKDTTGLNIKFNRVEVIPCSEE